MALFSQLFGRSDRPVRRSRPTLGFEPLEGRDLMSASPLPVLLVIADRQDWNERGPGDRPAAIVAQSEEPVAAVCHGVTVLAYARVDG